MVAYELSQDCALTVLLHASKYPSCTINGVLLGKPAQGSGPLVLSAAVPLFHSSSTYLSPCVEAALNQVDAYAQQQGLQIAGYYHSEYRYDASDIHATGKRIADKIADKCPAACIVALSSSKLAAFCGVQPERSSQQQQQQQQQPQLTSAAAGQSAPFDLYLRDASGRSSWKVVQQSAEAPVLYVSGGSTSAGGADALKKRFLNLFNSSRHLEVADFDEHLDDLSRDYTNKALLGAATQLISR